MICGTCDNMKDRIFKKTKWGPTFPRAEDGRMLRAYRIYTTGRMGPCSCCSEDAFAQIVLYDAKIGGSRGKTSFFSCRKHASLFVEDYHRQTDRKVKAWDDGWEIACDFCGSDCAEKPRVYENIPEYKGASMASRFTHTICDTCYEMEALFA